MPGSGSKKQQQRTKGNVRPSSSSQAAELLNLTGNTPTGFIGFGQAPKYVPASSSLDDMDTSLDPDFRMVLRKFTKRDSTTKVKACQEFSDLCQEKPVECLTSVLPFWPRIFIKLVMDIDYRVREATQQCMNVLSVRVGRNLAPYLKKLMGAWLLAQCDTYPTVASAAQASFQAAFSPAKQVEAISFCKEKILEYLCENLVKHTPTTLSDPKQTEQEDMDNKYNRVLTSSFLALRKLFLSIPQKDLTSLEDSLVVLLDDPKLWKHGKSKIIMVRGAMYSFMAGLCQTELSLVVKYTDKMTPFILHNLDEKDPAITASLWEAVLSLVNFVEECWKSVNIQKAFWPKLKNVLENGCHGNAVVVCPSLLPLLSKIPEDAFQDYNKFLDDFFFNFRKGLGSSSAQKSSSECGALVKAYMECATLVVKQHQDTQVPGHIVIDQVLPVVQASLLEGSSQLSTTPLYGMLGKILTGLETNNEQGAQSALLFWTSLSETAENQLLHQETSSDIFEKRIVYLVKCLYYPQVETRTKKKKVGFEVNKIETKESEKDILLFNESKAELGKHGKTFVQNLILLTFKLAHKHFSKNHLCMLAELLELDSSDEVVAIVIESCHGDVTSESPLKYFVFEICIPWLKEIQQSSMDNEGLIHLIQIVCLFVPSLDSDSAITLLDKLYESCIDSASENVLMSKVLKMLPCSSSVTSWVQGTKFGEKWVERSRSIRKMTLSVECQEIVNNTLNVLGEVLKAKQNGEILVKKEYLMQVFEDIVEVLEKLDIQDSKDDADTVIQYVAHAILLYLIHYQISLESSCGDKAIEKLFQICVVNKHGLSEESLDLARKAWSKSLTYMVRLTGGLVYDDSVLKQLIEMTLFTLSSLSCLERLNTLFDNVKVLLESMITGLPDKDRENDVYKMVCGSLVAEVPIIVPEKVQVFMALKGEYPGVPGNGQEFKAKTLFTSLYNSQLLQYMMSRADDQEEGSTRSNRWSDEQLQCLLSCIQAGSVIQVVLEVDKIFANLSKVRESYEVLMEIIQALCLEMGESGMGRLWKLAFNKSEEQFNYSFSLGTILTLIKAVGKEPVVLQLDPLADRCCSVDSHTARMLHSTVLNLSSTDQLSMTEILVAKILTLPPDLVYDAKGVICSLSVITKLAASICDVHVEEVVQLLVGVLDQILVWKDKIADILAYSCTGQGNTFNVEVSRFLICIVSHIPSHLTDKHWDFIMCSIVTWIQELKEVTHDILGNKSPGLQCLLVSVLDLVSSVSDCLKVKVESDPGSYPPDLRTEWTEFFAESIFSEVFPIYLDLNKATQNKTPSGIDQLILGSVCCAVSKAPQTFLLNNELPPLLVAGELSPLPDNLQTLLNHIGPLLLARDDSVQLSAYLILSSIIDTLPAYDKEDKSIIVEASGGEEKDEETKKSPPQHLIKIIDKCQPLLEEFLCDVEISDHQPVIEDTLQHQHALGYLLSWRLVLEFFRSAPSELRQEYALYLREFGYVNNFVNSLFKLLPKIQKHLFSEPFQPNIKGGNRSTRISHLASDLYIMVLKTIPAMVRQWWKEQDRKTSAFVDTFTTKFVSENLFRAELQAVKNTDVKMEDMKIRTRPTAREVIATYGIEEVSVEIVITLPVNYPLGSISVTSEKRVGVSGAQWEKWLLQLNIFLTHQNGNIVDGLKLWRDNISKKFEGVEECMICFYVLHGTNFQLPRITCRTCKKKFHSACLYKWFNTSHNCTCPLCRNIF